MKKNISNKVEKYLLGFAAGVMIAASVWSLLIPAIEMTEKNGGIAWLPASVGFLLGIVFLLVIDMLLPHFNLKGNNEDKGLKKTAMLILAITLHNIPEGMAVGVIFAGLLAGSPGITVAGAFALSIGIAIQNFPEGAIVSMPLKSSGASKMKSFVWGFLSGIVEPIGALITICLTQIVVPILPYLLSFAAGAMIYVVSEELIPEIQAKKATNLGIIGVSLGFVIMMVLDVALG